MFSVKKPRKIFSGPLHCNTESVVYMLQCDCCNKKCIGSTKNKFRQRFNVYKSYFRTYARRHNEGSLATGKPVPQASFFSHFFDEQRGGNFSVSIRIIDGADNVYSLRRKELFWQYKLGTFSPAGQDKAQIVTGSQNTRKSSMASPLLAP